ncbi:hypothetical protein GGF50DRAFT_121151 [Schizophyllum commune]
MVLFRCPTASSVSSNDSSSSVLRHSSSRRSQNVRAEPYPRARRPLHRRESSLRIPGAFPRTPHGSQTSVDDAPAHPTGREARQSSSDQAAPLNTSASSPFHGRPLTARMFPFATPRSQSEAQVQSQARKRQKYLDALRSGQPGLDGYLERLTDNQLRVRYQAYKLSVKADLLRTRQQVIQLREEKEEQARRFAHELVDAETRFRSSHRTVVECLRAEHQETLQQLEIERQSRRKLQQRLDDLLAPIAPKNEFEAYDKFWCDINARTIPPSSFSIHDFPWPIPAHVGIDDITEKDMVEFLLDTRRPGARDATRGRRNVLRSEARKYHTDKWVTYGLAVIKPEDCRRATEVAEAISRILIQAFQKYR